MTNVQGGRREASLPPAEGFLTQYWSSLLQATHPVYRVTCCLLLLFMLVNLAVNKNKQISLRRKWSFWTQPHRCPGALIECRGTRTEKHCFMASWSPLELVRMWQDQVSHLPMSHNSVQERVFFPLIRMVRCSRESLPALNCRKTWL